MTERWSEHSAMTPSGAPLDDDVGVESGSAYVFERTGTAGDEETTGTAHLLQLEATQHRYLLLAETGVKVDRWISTRGNIHSNGLIEFLQGGPSTLGGNITSIGDVTIDRRHTIAGDVSSSGMIPIDNGSNVTGTVTENIAVVPVALPSFAYFAGGKKVSVRDRRFLALKPGSYDKVKVGRNAALYLFNDRTTGNYFFKDLDVRDRGLIWIATANGPVNINSVGRIRFHKRSWVWTSPFSDVAVLRTTVRSLFGNIDMDDSVYIRGSLIAPRGRVRFKRRGFLRGTICADEISIERDTFVSGPVTLPSGSLLPIFSIGKIIPPGVVPEQN